MAAKKRNILCRVLLWVCSAVLVFILFVVIDFAVKMYLWEGTSYPGIPESPAAHMEAGNWEDALDEMLYLLDQGKEYPNIRFYIAQCYKNIGIMSFKEQRYDDALADFEDGLWYDEDGPGLQICFATTCLAMSRYDQAESAYKKVLASEPNNVQALKELGEIYYLRNDFENTEIVWRQALALNPDDVALENRLSKFRKEVAVVDSFDSDESLKFKIFYDGESMSSFEYDVLEIMDDAYYDIGGRLMIWPKRQVSVTLLTKEAFFDITESPDWSSGWYEGQIKIPVANAEADALREILTHEYVHAVLFDQIGNKCPWWLNEGLAQYFSKTDDDIVNSLAYDFENSSSRKLIKRLTRSDAIKMDEEEALLAYANALSAVSFLVDSYGEIILQRIIESMAEGKTFENSFWNATGRSFEEFEAEWRRD